MLKRLSLILGLGALFVFPTLVGAQGMMGGWSPSSASSVDVTQTTQEETTGQSVWEHLQNKSTTCTQLQDADFDALGEYFMGQMMGSTVHANMNATMKTQLGENGETQMHIALGKRLSSCDPAAAFPSNGQGFATMFSMMNGGSMMGNLSGYNGGYGWSGMMGSWGAAGTAVNWLWMVLVWVLVIIAIIALWRWARHEQAPKTGSALEVLKTRYAKGEIDAKEYTEKRSVLEN